MPRTVALTPRRRPSQARAQASVDRILDATAELLDEVGFEGLTTNTIAAKAGVNVASLYKYFPNKFAVLTALAHRMREAQVDLLRSILRPGADWREALDQILAVFVDLFTNTPGFAELAATLAVSPALRAIDEQSLAAEAEAIAEAMPAMGIALPKADRNAIARVMLEAVRGVLPLVRRAKPAQRRRLLREERRMIEAYLATYLD